MSNVTVYDADTGTLLGHFDAPWGEHSEECLEDALFEATDEAWEVVRTDFGAAYVRRRELDDTWASADAE